MFFLYVSLQKNKVMKRPLSLICYYLGLWGILGFFVTLIFGFISCCANLSEDVFYISLIAFAALGITTTSLCVVKGCRKGEKA